MRLAPDDPQRPRVIGIAVICAIALVIALVVQFGVDHLTPGMNTFLGAVIAGAFPGLGASLAILLPQRPLRSALHAVRRRRRPGPDGTSRARVDLRKKSSGT